jgi:hypothetical protein
MKTILLFLVAVLSFTVSAQERGSTAPPEVIAQIARLDSAILDALMGYFTRDLEFYHDKGGFSGYDSTRVNFKRLFDSNRDTGMRRDLVPGSLEVHPIGNFGVLEICQHRFCHQENGREDCGTFKNIMLWRNDNGTWRVSRVISYDH